MEITRLIVKNFKGIKSADVNFHSGANILVGDNGVGKSTIIEALQLVLGDGIRQLDITHFLFHQSTWKEFDETKALPKIEVEVFFSYDESLEEYKGKMNSQHIDAVGIRMVIDCSEEGRVLLNSNKDHYAQIPSEYYAYSRMWFSGAMVSQWMVPYYTIVVDSSTPFFLSKADYLATKIMTERLSNQDKVNLRKALHRVGASFADDEFVKKLKLELSQGSRELTFNIDMESNKVGNMIIKPFLDEIPYNQIGLGEQNIIKTLLSIDKGHQTSKKFQILIVEEPESHLSHTKMRELMAVLSSIEGQAIISTHNSFVANRLDLKNVIMLSKDNEGKISSQPFDSLSNSTTSYFQKAANYPTLRLVLCQKAILVEGPADEMIIEYYFKKNGMPSPIEQGIELICVNGLMFKYFIEIAKCLNKKVAVITDNDGQTMNDVSKRYLNQDEKDINVFTCPDPQLNTLEPCFVRANISRLQELSNFIRIRQKANDTEQDLVNYMEDHKTEWSFKVYNSLNDEKQEGNEQINDNASNKRWDFPQYIKDAIEWILT